jgi:hypothetical protein
MACKTTGRWRSGRLKHLVSKKFTHVGWPRLGDVDCLDSLDEYVLKTS